MSDHHSLMGIALEEARKSLRAGTMPIGAVLAVDGRVIARAHWKGPAGGLLEHPEQVVLRRADKQIAWADRRRAILYTTLEPCLMCMGAGMSFFLGTVVFGLPAPADGASSVATQWHPTLGHPVGGGAYSIPAVQAGVRAEEARALVQAWLDSGVSGGEADFARLTLS